jgi:putative DNA primase/helicase
MRPTMGEIARALGGALRSGEWWRCRCPVHDSGGATLGLRDGERGLIVKCFAGCDPRDVLAELRLRQLIEGSGAPQHRAQPTPSNARTDDDAHRIATARRLWEAARDARGSPVVRYLAGRGITMPPLSSLRWAPRCWHREARAHLPAMVALVEHAERGVVAVHRTYIVRDDAGIWRRRDRASLGPIAGGAVRLGAVRPDQWLVIGEGIETTFSVMQSCDLPGWAALSAGGITRLILPPEAHMILVAADNDENGIGERAARVAATRWLAEGRKVRIVMSTVPGTDFADLLIGPGHARKARDVAA